uniref:HAT C-terminal dimerisation domain-containing protein n=1 Tax=Kalanchoe fedtschenkoi TaxID=63787 RepID=A0A7N0SZ13_KALFE
MSKFRGQGYDGASNMKGEIHGLKTLIMNDTSSAYYINCFAHQLQSTLVAVAKDNCDCAWLFEQLSYLLSVIGVSCKHKEMIQVIQAQKGRRSLKLGLYPIITEVLVIIGKSASNKENCAKAQVVLGSFESFHFVLAHLMLYIFGYTDQLSNALQQKDQGIRNDNWEDFIEKVTTFGVKYDIEVPDRDGYYVPQGRAKRFFKKMFLSVIDLHVQELSNRFDEVNMELLICMDSLNPANSFTTFDKHKILRLAESYPNEFTMQMKDLGGLSSMLVETNKHKTYTEVCLLLKLVLILSVATSVERVFSSMSSKLKKRNLHTFLNALTYPNRTCYLVALTNTKLVLRVHGKIGDDAPSEYVQMEELSN